MDVAWTVWKQVHNCRLLDPCPFHPLVYRCLVNGQCNKKFPRPFMANTMTDRDGYPLYRRRRPADGGQVIEILRSSGARHRYDNRHVVPYNPALLRIFKCHINVESVASISSIKYVCKYVNKGLFHTFESSVHYIFSFIRSRQSCGRVAATKW